MSKPAFRTNAPMTPAFYKLAPMENTGSVIAGLLALCAVGYLAYRVAQERKKLDPVMAVLRDGSDPLVEALDRLVLSGELTPSSAGT